MAGGEQEPPLVLASASPRRRRLLREAGFQFECVDPGDEGCPAESEPGRRVLAHARAKAAAVARMRPGARVLAADTLVWCGGEALGKPAGVAEARRMLLLLEGREHTVWTGVSLTLPGGRRLEHADRARVAFGRIPRPDLEAYLGGREWADKAGAYAIQGAAGAWARLVEGEWETVVGLSTATVRALLAAACSGSAGG